MQADYHFRRLNIWLTRGPQVADFLAVLRVMVARIVSRIDIKYKQNIRLPQEPRADQSAFSQEPETGNYQQILGMRNDGQTFYWSDSGTKYVISKLLGLFEQTGDGTGGDTTFNIENCKFGDLTVTGKMTGSFNRGTK